MRIRTLSIMLYHAIINLMTVCTITLDQVNAKSKLVLPKNTFLCNEMDYF